MIRLATIEDQSALVRLCKKDAWDGTTILSAFQSKCADVYNADWQYCDIWMGTSDAQNKNAQYVLCRLGQTFHIVGKPHSKQRWEELYSFLSMQAPKSKLIADSQMIAQYQERFPSPACKLPHPNQSIPFPRMISTRLPEAMEENSVQESTSLFSIYDILASAKPEMLKRVSRDEYTARMLFSKRGGAKFFEIPGEDGAPICVGAILLPDEGDYGLIFNICTLPEHRGKGYARKMVTRLCMEAYLQGKTPVLDCAETQLEQYYSHLGFQKVSYWDTAYPAGYADIVS